MEPKAPSKNSRIQFDHATAQLLDAGLISAFWNQIQHAIASALPEKQAKNPAVMTEIMGALMTGAMQGWALFTMRDEKPVLVGFATTMIRDDKYMGEKLLNIYTIYVAQVATAGAWARLYETIERYAKGQGCTQIMAFTPHEHLVRVAERLGFDTSWRLVKKEV